jgi:hypothetical protein
MGASKKSYEDLQMGFDRTQLYKEYTQPQINRSAALQAVMNFCKVNQIKLVNVEIMALTKKYVDFIETGDTSWAKAVDKYLMSKYEEI